MYNIGRLCGKLALVTGAGSGIGRSVCALFGREGAKIAAIDVNDAGLDGTKLLCSNDYYSIVADCSNSGNVTQAFHSIHQHFNEVPSIIVNCAGITRDNFLSDLEEEAFDEVIRVNLKSTFLVIKQATSLLNQTNTPGSIINIASIVGKCGNKGQANYAASKAGVIGLTKTVAKEMGKFGIRCNAVLPGFIKTPMTDHVPENVMNIMKAQIPLKTLGEPLDVANVCLFLASSESKYVTGASLEVTGGLMF